ncbi:MAG: hypothetical protein J7L31_00490 [Thermoplasmata archaeon]|nr:hypothetical protein [Thermoplasmata archaeon]
MEDVIDIIEKGIIVEIEDMRESLTVNKVAHGVFIGDFDLELVEEAADALDIPVIASCRVGHFVEARVLERLGVAMIDESNPNEIEHMDKKSFSIPFVCKVETPEEAMRRYEEGARAVRTEFGRVDEVVGLIKDIKEKKKDAFVIASLTIATPADVSFLFQIGCDGIIVSSEIFRSPNPLGLLEALVNSARYYNEMEKIVAFSKSASKLLPSGAK